MKYTSFVVAAVTALVFAGNALAAPPDEKQQQKKRQRIINQLNYQSFIDSCDSSGYQANQQVAPDSIVVSCSKMETYWVSGKGETQPLPTVVEIESKLTSNKSTVAKSVADVSPPAGTGTQNCWVEKKKTYPQINEKSSCRTLKRYKSLAAFCAHAISQKLIFDRSFKGNIQVEATGKSVGHCDKSSGAGKGSWKKAEEQGGKE